MEGEEPLGARFKQRIKVCRVYEGLLVTRVHNLNIYSSYGKECRQRLV